MVSTLTATDSLVSDPTEEHDLNRWPRTGGPPQELVTGSASEGVRPRHSEGRALSLVDQLLARLIPAPTFGVQCVGAPTATSR
jgi:hypothetical protein